MIFVITFVCVVSKSYCTNTTVDKKHESITEESSGHTNEHSVISKECSNVVTKQPVLSSKISLNKEDGESLTVKKESDILDENLDKGLKDDTEYSAMRNNISEKVRQNEGKVDEVLDVKKENEDSDSFNCCKECVCMFCEPCRKKEKDESKSKENSESRITDRQMFSLSHCCVLFCECFFKFFEVFLR